MRGRRFRPTKAGRFKPSLTEPERELLRSLPAQAEALLRSADGSTRRLFPTAYPDDEEKEAEYRSLVGPSLMDHHRAALQALAASADHEEIDLDEMHQWMAALEGLRLVLGTQLDVSESTEDPADLDPDDPRGPRLTMYRYLSWLQDQMVVSLSESLTT